MTLASRNGTRKLGKVAKEMFPNVGWLLVSFDAMTITTPFVSQKFMNFYGIIE